MLNNLEKLKEIGAECKVVNAVSTAKDKLSEAIWKLTENGQTALGPALVVSIAMASAKPGSQVILCTDGLANIGVGSLEAKPLESASTSDQIENEEDEEEEEDVILKWYEALGDYAMSKGVVVNIISITDDGCKLENLGKIVEITNGNLKRINPLNLAEKFSGIIENESIATNCQAKMLLHPGLKFHNTSEVVKVDLDNIGQKDHEVIEESAKEQKENKENENDDDSQQVDKLNEGRKIYKVSKSSQDCGNVFEGSQIFFEYVIDKSKETEFKKLKVLPFQVQIEYQKKDGSRMMRVISQTKEITLDRSKVRENLDFDVMAQYGQHVTTELCAKGDYESSRAWTSANTSYMNRNANNNRQMFALANYAQQNVALDYQMQQQIQTEQVQQMQVPQQNFNAFSFASSMSARKKGKKKKEKARKGARNDQFSSAMYSMKSKAKRSRKSNK